MKKISLILISIFSIVLFFSGCTTSVMNDMISINKNAGQKLLDKSKVYENSSVVMTTIVNIDELEKSSTLGRTISEQIIGVLVDNGMRVNEMKLRNNVYIKSDTGELVLSREVSKLAKKVNAEYIVAGIYSEASDYVYVNLKLIRPSDSIILAAYDYKLEKDSDIYRLLYK